MRIAIIAEKPSVVREIAAIVGASHKEDGFLHGNGYMVTWALGAGGSVRFVTILSTY